MLDDIVTLQAEGFPNIFIVLTSALVMPRGNVTSITSNVTIKGVKLCWAESASVSHVSHAPVFRLLNLGFHLLLCTTPRFQAILTSLT